MSELIQTGLGATDTLQKILRLNWICTNKPTLAILWYLIGWKGQDGTFPTSNIAIYGNRLNSFFKEHLGEVINARSVRLAAQDLLNQQILVDRTDNSSWHKTPCVELHWPAVAEQLLQTQTIPLPMLELNWIAANRAELAVLWELKECFDQAGPYAFTRSSTRDLAARYRPILGDTANDRSISRAIHRLESKGLIVMESAGLKSVQRIRIHMPDVKAQLSVLHALPLQDLWGV